LSLYLAQYTDEGLLHFAHQYGGDDDPHEQFEIRDSSGGGYYHVKKNFYLTEDEVLIIADLEE